jgi:hypothetical protein
MSELEGYGIFIFGNVYSRRNGSGCGYDGETDGSGLGCGMLYGFSNGNGYGGIGYRLNSVNRGDGECFGNGEGNGFGIGID